MTSENITVCAPLCAGRVGSHYPAWFDAVCKQRRKVFREAVQSSQAEHAFLQPKRTQITHLAEPAWGAYLNEHIRSFMHQQTQRPHYGRHGLSARDFAVPLERDTPPSRVLLLQGARAVWIPMHDVVSAPSLDTMHTHLMAAGHRKGGEGFGWLGPGARSH
eukprot:506868-Pelagomonas_calceolata.AAC.1